jgi:hypothetical protein
MIQTFETDSIIYKILNASTTLKSSISGDIYVMGERPDDSEKEDIAINTIGLTQDNPPQLGTSNVNIHVADIDVKISGVNQKKTNVEKLKGLTKIVLDTLTAASVTGLSFWVTNQTTLQDPDKPQHYVNLRIEWSIH